MPAESDPAESLPTPRDGSRQTSSKRPDLALAPPERFDRHSSNPVVTALSPPPSSKVTQPQLQHSKSHVRLRSDSGLAFQTNQPVFRQYAGYGPEGSVPSRSGPATLKIEEKDSVEDFRFCLGNRRSTELQGFVAHDKVVPDFFANPWVKMAFSSTETGQRLRRFAETRHGGADIDFVLKVEQCSRELGNMISSMSYISSHFTSTTATSPLELPPEVACALRSNTKYGVRTALPALDKLYQDAKSAVEDRLSRHLYPEFVKYQFSQCLAASLSATRSLTGECTSPYPGLGNAFCLTDPLLPDNPIVHASDGLLVMCGFPRKELVGKNSRVLQGVATDPGAARRLSQAVAGGRPFTELILNYRPDETPYWNFLFICPLTEHGSVRYYLGAQVNVSENMGSEYKDMEDVMKFGPPPIHFQPARTAAPPTSPSWPPRRGSRTSDLDQPKDQRKDQPTENQISRRHRFFKRFRRKPPSSRTSSPSRPSTPSDLATEENPPPLPARGYHSPLAPRPEDQSQQLDENSTPYSRFFVMRFPALSPHCRRGPRLTRDRDRDPRPLPIAFYSTFALSLLGMRQDESCVLLNRDIFEVLSTQLGSPSANRAFKKNVIGKLAAGETVHADVMVPTELAAGSSSGDGGGGGGGGTPAPARGGGGSGGGETGEAKPRSSGTLERGTELFNQVFFGGQGKLRRFVSSWVPLKDAEGEVGFVVLVLTPADGTAASE
ncbi:hypothetical protein C8A03DRAFT_45493 [Achaetomium macrosporum]|uniref:PAS domain-containing protein n=1 Tax=Achaetomium macrosporum TaxID=79813 RepID=A0AAN7H5Y0_9PEZI|nr:hypothetical protein C8A03DRAFT_45493 [Achaetomium macrosporum]